MKIAEIILPAAHISGELMSFFVVHRCGGRQCAGVCEQSSMGAKFSINTISLSSKIRKLWEIIHS